MTANHTAGATAQAAVSLPGGGCEVRTFDLRPHGEDDGWLRVEASGICGTDVALRSAGLTGPTVLGHHVHGRIAASGDTAARRWGAAPGDRVVIEEYLPCGACERCAAGRYRLCPRTDLWSGGRRVGLVPVGEPPSLWGGNAQYVYLPPESVVHTLPEHLPDPLAAWVLPLANALDWVLGAGELASGGTLVVLGPGYHGLAAVAAARQAGAGTVVVAGLPQDRARLDIAASMGADTAVTFDGNPTELHEHVTRRTGGRMADVVLDLTGVRPHGLTPSLGLLTQGGRLILPGGAGRTDAAVDIGELTRLTAVVRGVRGRSPQRVAQSIEVLAKGDCGLEKVPTVEVTLEAVGTMLDRLAEGSGPATPHVVVRPWGVSNSPEGPADPALKVARRDGR
ncbi:MAG: alcohol dehydrogenase catalytic domain-containing protein [Streptomyces sp.]|uniref:alcohol dehydrogenase catalytic domain-containing protein n=1 Tax=Streptomyces sp. TaxID=1931 RepID=UPI003D6B17F9